MRLWVFGTPEARSFPKAEIVKLELHLQQMCSRPKSEYKKPPSTRVFKGYRQPIIQASPTISKPFDRYKTES